MFLVPIVQDALPITPNYPYCTLLFLSYRSMRHMLNGQIRFVHDLIKLVRRLMEVILSTPQPERLLLDRMFLAPIERDALPIAPIYRYWKLMIFAYRSMRHMLNGQIRFV